MSSTLDVGSGIVGLGDLERAEAAVCITDGLNGSGGLDKRGADCCRDSSHDHGRILGRCVVGAESVDAAELVDTAGDVISK